MKHELHMHLKMLAEKLNYYCYSIIIANVMFMCCALSSSVSVATTQHVAPLLCMSGKVFHWDLTASAARGHQ